MTICGNLLTKFLGTLMLTASLASACSCPPLEPPCQAVSSSAYIFVGTVTSVQSGRETLRFATMQINQVFKGSLPPSITLVDDGMCNGPQLHVGGQYLLYTEKRGDGSGLFDARGCTRSRALKDAQEDLTFLNAYVAGKTDTLVRGRVSDEQGVPLSSVPVSISRKNAKPQVVNTDSTGAFQFVHQPPGDYQIDIRVDGFEETGRLFFVNKGTCAEQHLTAFADRRILGTVRDAAGLPLGGLRLRLLPVASSRSTFTDDATTSAKGTYSFSRVPPGEYYVGTNLDCAPSPDSPYPRLYYPNATTPDLAQSIPIGLGPNVHHVDLRVPAPLPILTINGKIIDATGLPPLLADRPGINIWDPMNRCPIWQNVDIRTDGHFELRLCQGITYTITAFTKRVGALSSSKPMTITVSPRAPELILTLN